MTSEGQKTATHERIFKVMTIITLPGEGQPTPPENYEEINAKTLALRLKGACFVVDFRFESLQALSFMGACFVIDFRFESLAHMLRKLKRKKSTETGQTSNPS